MIAVTCLVMPQHVLPNGKIEKKKSLPLTIISGPLKWIFVDASTACVAEELLSGCTSRPPSFPEPFPCKSSWERGCQLTIFRDQPFLSFKNKGINSLRYESRG